MRGQCTISLSLAAVAALTGRAMAEPPSVPAAEPIVSADPATEIDVASSQPERARHMTPLAWTLVTAGAVSLGASAFLAVTSLSDGERCERNPSCEMSEMDAISDRLVVADLL